MKMFILHPFLGGILCFWNKMLQHSLFNIQSKNKKMNSNLTSVSKCELQPPAKSRKIKFSDLKTVGLFNKKFFKTKRTFL